MKSLSDRDVLAVGILLARDTSTKRRAYFCNDQIQKEHDACTKSQI